MSTTFTLTDPDVDTCDQLLAFERQFDYPLNEQNRFRIQHSQDYNRFFRAMGEAVTVVYRHSEVIRGVLSGSLRTLVNKAGESERWLYIGDVKIQAAFRRQLVLSRLFKATVAWVGGRCDRSYSVVMEGTAVLPSDYTGRASIPAFEPTEKVFLFCILTDQPLSSSTRIESEKMNSAELVAGPKNSIVPSHLWSDCFPGLRSKQDPTWLFNPESGSCALLEDTRRAKQLFDESENEIAFAHLTNIRYNDVADLIPLVVDASILARTSGCTELLVALPEKDRMQFAKNLAGIKYRTLSATVFAFGAEETTKLPIHSSEI